MASEQDVTSDSLDSSVVPVPKELLGFVKTRIADYINKATTEEFSANIHYAEGQAPKLEVSLGDPRCTTGTQASKVLTNTNTLLVKNIPNNADEELLEMFFESTKKQGGGPVKSVKILSDKNIAFIEFCDRKSVETVMKKRPIKLGKTELDVQPYSPLIKGSRKINRVDLIGFAGEFTDDLVKRQFEYLSRGPIPDYGPELRALIKVGSRVVRGRDWNSELNIDGGGRGTVTMIYKDSRVTVQWDTGYEGSHSLGCNGKYEIKLAP